MIANRATHRHADQILGVIFIVALLLLTSSSVFAGPYDTQLPKGVTPGAGVQVMIQH